MESRRPRLGDNIDDYCPRERRLANHVVVAIIGDDVKQTRCTTCDTEHPYKNAKVPPRRKKPAAAALLQAADAAAERPRLAPELDEDATLAEPAPPPAPPPSTTPDIHALFASLDAAPDPAPAETVEEGPVHRRLIRAQLPRIEGEAPARPIPEFTMRQPLARPGRFGRHGGARFGGNGFRSQGAPGVMTSGTWSNGNGSGNGAANGNGNGRQRQKSGNGGRSSGRPNGFNKKSR